MKLALQTVREVNDIRIYKPQPRRIKIHSREKLINPTHTKISAKLNLSCKLGSHCRAPVEINIYYYLLLLLQTYIRSMAFFMLLSMLRMFLNTAAIFKCTICYVNMQLFCLKWVKFACT